MTSGTDKTKTSATSNAPAIILVDPQMGENIGAAARAMLNCGLTDLRLVNPRDGWPNERANAMSVGALEKMPDVKVYKTLKDALAEFHYVYATSARLRELEKPVMTAHEAVTDMKSRTNNNQNTAILFGAERTGLTNDDVALADYLINIPLNPSFSSLNLGQAVLLLAYEWSQTDETFKPASVPTAPATHAELQGLLDRLMNELDDHNFFRSVEVKPHMVRNLTTTLTRAGMTEQEIATFHGMISALTGKKTPRTNK